MYKVNCVFVEKCFELLMYFNFNILLLLRFLVIGLKCYYNV